MEIEVTPNCFIATRLLTSGLRYPAVWGRYIKGDAPGEYAANR